MGLSSCSQNLKNQNCTYYDTVIHSKSIFSYQTYYYKLYFFISVQKTVTLKNIKTIKENQTFAKKWKKTWWIIFTAVLQQKGDIYEFICISIWQKKNKRGREKKGAAGFWMLQFITPCKIITPGHPKQLNFGS